MDSVNYELWEPVSVEALSFNYSEINEQIVNLFKLRQNQSAELFYGDCLIKFTFIYVLNFFMHDSWDPTAKKVMEAAQSRIFSRIEELGQFSYEFNHHLESIEEVRKWKFSFSNRAINSHYNPAALTLPLTHPTEMMRFIFDKTACLGILFFSSNPQEALTLTGMDAFDLRFNYHSSVFWARRSVILCVHQFQPWKTGKKVSNLVSYFSEPFFDFVENPSDWPLIASVFEQEKMQIGNIEAKTIMESSFYLLLTDAPFWNRCVGWVRQFNAIANATDNKELNLRIADQYVLYQIIERIALVNRESKGRNKTDLELIRLKWLGWLFDEMYARIKSSNLSVSLSSMVKSEVFSFITLGFIKTKIVPAQEFYLKRGLADKGYSFFTEASNMLKTEFPERDTGPVEFIKSLLVDFQDWAAKNPVPALDMMSSIWHAAGVLQSGEFTRRIQTGLTGRYFTHHLLVALGESNQNLEKDQEKYLKFVCLWEFCHYLPYLADLFKEGFNPLGGYASWGNLFARMAKVKLEQRVIQAVPGEWAGNVALIAEVVRGESLYHILQTNAQIQLLGVAGKVGGFLWNPGNLLSLIKIEFLNWSRPLKHISARVALVHLGIPLAGMAGLSLSLASLPFVPGLMIGLSFSVMAYQLYKFLREPDLENYAKVLLRNRNLRGEIRAEVIAYLRNAKNTYSIVQVRSNEVVEETDASEVIKALRGETPTTASEAVQCFNMALKGEKDSVIRKAEKQWLEPTLIEIFMKEACKFYLEEMHESELSPLPIDGERVLSTEQIRKLIRHQLGTDSCDTEKAVESIFEMR